MTYLKIPIFILMVGIVFRSVILYSEPTASTSQVTAGEVDMLVESFSDGKGILENVTGTVKVLRTGSDQWVSAKEKDTVNQGDQIKTSESSSVDLVYDDSALNVTHLEENTIAQFNAIEPTLIYLVDGSIFNSLEALPDGQSYEIATDTAVNAVRGTQFLRTYSSVNQMDTTVCTDGEVETYSITMYGALSSESQKVEKGTSLTVTPQMLMKKPISQIFLTPATIDEQGRINAILAGIETGLTNSIRGGVEGLKQKREHIKMVMTQPEFQAKIQAKQGEFARKRIQAFKALTQGNGPIAQFIKKMFGPKSGKTQTPTQSASPTRSSSSSGSQNYDRHEVTVQNAATAEEEKDDETPNVQISEG